jgi:hypothetical protein
MMGRGVWQRMSNQLYKVTNERRKFHDTKAFFEIQWAMALHPQSTDGPHWKLGSRGAHLCNMQCVTAENVQYQGPCSSTKRRILGSALAAVTQAGSTLNGSMGWTEENVNVLQSGGGASAHMRFYNLGIVDGGTGKHRRGQSQIGGAAPASGGKVAACPGGEGEGESGRE